LQSSGSGSRISEDCAGSDHDVDLGRIDQRLLSMTQCMSSELAQVRP
jgi:hypothetical protein